MDFSKFNKMVNLDGLKNEIKESEEHQSDYDEVPPGTYEVDIEQMELTESKKGDPMFSCWFRIESNSQKDRLIFMNQVINQGFQVHIVNTLLKSLDTGYDIHFDDFEQYARLISEVYKAIKEDHLKFKLVYGKRKDFPTFKIEEVYESPF